MFSSKCYFYLKSDVVRIKRIYKPARTSLCLSSVRWKTWSAECGVRSVENAECGKCGVWKTRSVENAGCGK